MFSPAPYPSTPSFRTPYKSAHKRAQIVRILLIVGAALDVVMLFFFLLHFLAPGTVITDDTTEPITIIIALMESGVALMAVAVYFATIVVFLMWMYRSFENLPALGVPRASIGFSSGWAVGSFFVPIVLLFAPYQATKELWKKSRPMALGSSGPPAFFPSWWAFWLMSLIAGNLYFRLSFSERLSPEADAMLGSVSTVLSIIAAVFAIMVVKEIDKQQTESARLIGQGTVSSEPPLPDMFMKPGVESPTGA